MSLTLVHPDIPLSEGTSHRHSADVSDTSPLRYTRTSYDNRLIEFISADVSYKLLSIQISIYLALDYLVYLY